MNAHATMPVHATARPTRSISAIFKATFKRVMSEVQHEKLVSVASGHGWRCGQSGQNDEPKASLYLGPSTVGGVLDRAFDVLRARFGLLMGASLVLFVPARVFLFFEIRPALRGSLWGGVLEVCVLVAVTTMLGALAARVFGAHISGEDASYSHVLRISALEFVGLLLLSTVTGILAGLGVFAFLVGTFFVSWLLAIAPVVYVLEVESRPLARVLSSMRRSVSLVAGSFWRWLCLVVLLGLLGQFLQLPITKLDDPIFRYSLTLDYGLSAGLVDLVVCLLGAVFMALIAISWGVVFASFYFDQRARLEGVDLYLALRARELSVR